jgi:hypothetical protein
MATDGSRWEERLDPDTDLSLEPPVDRIFEVLQSTGFRKALMSI